MATRAETQQNDETFNGGDNQSMKEAALESKSADKVVVFSPLEAQHYDNESCYDDDSEDYSTVTWGEVYQACCFHTPRQWGVILFGLFVVAFFFYWFLFGLELLSAGAKVMTGCAAGALFGDDTNPIAAMMIGILATVLLQSSSTSTSIIVAMVGPAISVNSGIYMMMGANVGTTATSTFVALGLMNDEDQLELAFAGANTHNMFNFLTAAILLPLELSTHFLAIVTALMTHPFNPQKEGTWKGPIKGIVAPLALDIIRSNDILIEGIAEGHGSCESGGGYYPIVCTDPDNPTYDSCPQVGLIACDSESNKCPAFFQAFATAADDEVSGGVVVFIGILIMFSCLFALILILQKILRGVSSAIIYKATNVNGYLGIAIGTAITMLSQSSTVTVSTLTPLVGIGMLQIEQMYPLVLGANVGTCVTAIMASMVANGTGGLQVALSHLLFNIIGVLIWYPIPFLRQIPINLSRSMGKATRVWRGFPFVYLATMFAIFPLICLGISMLFTQHKIGLTVLGSIFSAFIIVAILYTAYWWRFRDGRQSCLLCFERRERRRIALRDLPENIELLRARVFELTAQVEVLTVHNNGSLKSNVNGFSEEEKEEERLCLVHIDGKEEEGLCGDQLNAKTATRTPLFSPDK